MKTPSFPQCWWCDNVVAFTRSQSVPGGLGSHFGLESCSETRKMKEWNTYWGNSCNPHLGITGPLQWGTRSFNKRNYGPWPCPACTNHLAVLYSGLSWMSQTLSLLRAVGWVLRVAHKATAVEQNIWRWEPLCSHKPCSWCASALPSGILLACTAMSGVSWVMSRNDQRICLGHAFLTLTEMVM